MNILIIVEQIAQIATFYESIQHISNNYGMNVDSHMMKNMEWGAVAYLTQSKYGRCANGICKEMAKNDSSDCYTGRSLGLPSNADGEYSPSGTYTYEKPLGQLASTTGNTYGIYDMSGGSWEYVMGNMVTENNEFYPSSSGFLITPESKYYDFYTYDEQKESGNITHSRGKLGDATKETLIKYGSAGGAGWYKDSSYFIHSSSTEQFSWLMRGGSYNSTYTAGVFRTHDTGGKIYNNDDSKHSARVALVH